VSRINLERTALLIDNVSHRVKFTGVRPGFEAEFGLAFGDYVEAYNPRCQQESNNVMLVRTEPCIALYPSANRNGSWVLYNLNTKTYIRHTQWKKVPTSQLVINQMNELSGEGGISLADLEVIPTLPAEEQATEAIFSHQPNPDQSVETTAEEANIVDDVPMPDLVDQDQDNVSDAEDEVDAEDELKNQDELENVLQQDSDSSVDRAAKDLEEIAMQEVGNAIRRSKRTTAGVRRYDESYEWNLMNLSVNTALRDFGEVADKACEDELKQLFREKKALVPVKWETLNDKQKRQIVKSHMFLKQKFKDGSFVKLKARLVADGRTQDRSLFSDYSLPTTKT
jgi:hypothetical protein